MPRFFASTVPGLEHILSAEVAALGLTPLRLPPVIISGESRDDAGGVEFEAGLMDMQRANLWLRTAGRVLYRMGEFRAIGLSELRKKASAMPWELFLQPGRPVSLRVACHKSRLYHSGAVAERVLGAISDRLKKPVEARKFDEEAPVLPQLIVVRLVNDLCAVSIDTSGSRLHRRGYRLETAKAPLRETLAAGLLLAAGWDGASPLVDPFCGSGAIAIEAALIARRIAPGKNRRFAFMDWPGFDPALWKRLVQEAAGQELPAPPAPILASDRDEGAVHICHSNAARAGVEGDIQITRRAFSDMESQPVPGWIVTNPPYGVRVSPNKDLRNLYSQLGNVLMEKFPGWNVGLLTAGEFYAGHTRLQFGKPLDMVNGGLKVQFFTGRVPDTRKSP
jgi:putative N6-adenine-specific DNA methylase